MRKFIATVVVFVAVAIPASPAIAGWASFLWRIIKMPSVVNN